MIVSQSAKSNSPNKLFSPGNDYRTINMKAVFHLKGKILIHVPVEQRQTSSLPFMDVNNIGLSCRYLQKDSTQSNIIQNMV